MSTLTCSRQKFLNNKNCVEQYDMVIVQCDTTNEAWTFLRYADTLDGISAGFPSLIPNNFGKYTVKICKDNNAV